MSSKIEESLMQTAKFAYLVWKDHMDKECMWSYPLWDYLSEKKRAWWCNYVLEIYERRTIDMQKPQNK